MTGRKDATADRDARLAEALRANLRRRKQQAQDRKESAPASGEEPAASSEPD